MLHRPALVAVLAAVAAGPGLLPAGSALMQRASAAQSAASALDLSQLHWSIVQVRVRARVDGRTVQYRLGTGVYLGNGRVLTAKHLFEEYLDAEVIFGGRERVVPVVREWKPADEAAFYDQTDVAMLTGVAAPTWARGVRIADAPPAVGETVTSVGLGDPSLLRVRSGPVTATRSLDGTFESVMHSQHGDSGGPTFNARGHLVGIHCANVTRSHANGGSSAAASQTSLSYDITRLNLNPR